MKHYEIMFIVKPGDEQLVITYVDKFTKLITDNNGVVNKADIWGEKALAYDLNGYKRGSYVLMTFHATPACIKEVDRVMRITDDVIRHMIISKSE